MDATTKAQCTKGPWEYYRGNLYQPDCGTIARFDVDLLGRDVNGELCAEAGTVLAETGLSPRELAEQRAELLRTCRNLTQWVAKAIADNAFKNCAAPHAAERHLDEATAAIARAEAKP